MAGPMRWPLLEPIRSRLADERGTLRKQAATRIALCYPSPYHVGMSSLGFQTIYREIHAHGDAAAERAFLPDDVGAWREARVPLCTYESQQPVASFSCLAFSISYELEITGLFEMLDLAGLPALREERDERHPLVVCGGPLTFSNPVPLAPFADVIVLGEAEELIHTLCDALTLPRHELRTRLSQHPGFYLPGLSSSWPGVAKADDDRLPARSQIVTPHTELRSMFLIEPERGCSRGCTYCVMRRTTNGGMRTVDPERVLEMVPDDARRVGLVGAAVTDHPRIVELVRTLVDEGREVGISSLRADRLCARPELISLLAQSGARTLTTAADGASERLRTALDRRTTAAQLLRVAGLAREAGFQRAGSATARRAPRRRRPPQTATARGLARSLRTPMPALQICYHDHCFDGVAAGAAFLRFYRDKVKPGPLDVSFRGMAHRAGQLFDQGVLAGEENAVA